MAIGVDVSTDCYVWLLSTGSGNGNVAKWADGYLVIFSESLWAVVGCVVVVFIAEDKETYIYIVMFCKNIELNIY